MCFGKFDNGEICFVKQIGGGFENGNTVEATTEESLYYPCHIVVNTNDKKGVYSDGKFQQLQYEIYMNKVIIDADICKLRQGSNDLGEFVMQSVVSSKLLNRMKIMI